MAKMECARACVCVCVCECVVCVQLRDARARVCAGENDNAICDTKPLMLRSSIMSKEEIFSGNVWCIRGVFS